MEWLLARVELDVMLPFKVTSGHGDDIESNYGKDVITM